MTDTLKGELISEWDVKLAAPHELGTVPGGMRRIFQVESGVARGRLTGDILPSGGDWLFLRPDGVARLDVRALLRGDDGSLIYAQYTGVLRIPADVRERMTRGETPDPSEYYFRSTPYFETASQKYAWLNSVVCVGIGRRTRSGVAYSIFAIA